MTCIIVEDQLPAQRILRKYIEDLGTLELVGVFSEASPLVEFLKTHQVDLIFLDIHLPKLTGIDFLKICPNPPHVILTTAYSDYALEGYELNVIDYLLKPFSYQRFVQAVSKVFAAIGSAEVKIKREEVFIKSGHDHIKVILKDILYIKSDADYTEVYEQERKHISSEPLRFWMDYLDSDQFIQIHKSYIVNMSKIEKISGNRVYMSNKEILPVGRVYKDQFSKRFLK